jgi:general stress protein YciG
MSSNTKAKPRGFAAMTPERRSEISRQGGVSAHRKGTAHQWNPTTAQEAGRKGGLARRTKAPSPPDPTQAAAKSAP